MKIISNIDSLSKSEVIQKIKNVDEIYVSVISRRNDIDDILASVKDKMFHIQLNVGANFDYNLLNRIKDKGVRYYGLSIQPVIKQFGTLKDSIRSILTNLQSFAPLNPRFVFPITNPQELDDIVDFYDKYKESTKTDPSIAIDTTRLDYNQREEVKKIARNLRLNGYDILIYIPYELETLP